MKIYPILSSCCFSMVRKKVLYTKNGESFILRLHALFAYKFVYESNILRSHSRRAFHYNRFTFFSSFFYAYKSVQNITNRLNPHNIIRSTCYFHSLESSLLLYKLTWMERKEYNYAGHHLFLS